MERREGARTLAKRPLAGLAKPAARLGEARARLGQAGCTLLALHPRCHCRAPVPLCLPERVMTAPLQVSEQ